MEGLGFLIDLARRTPPAARRDSGAGLEGEDRSVRRKPKGAKTSPCYAEPYCPSSRRINSIRSTPPLITTGATALRHSTCSPALHPNAPSQSIALWVAGAGMIFHGNSKR